jgi:preprotein translocase subunit SecD
MSASFQRDFELVPMADETAKPMLLERKVYITGDMLTDANLAFDQGGFGGVSVSLAFNKKGARRFEKLTGENLQRRLVRIISKATSTMSRFSSSLSLESSTSKVR